MHWLVRCKHERRFSRACGADVSFRDVTTKIPERGCDLGCEWRHAPEAWAEIWEKSVSCFPASEEEGWFSLACRGLVAGVTRDVGGGGRWKSLHRKMVSLSLCRKTFKLKGNKKFRTWTKKSSSVFLCFGIPMLSIYVGYENYDRFAYRYEYIYFTYPYHGYVTHFLGCTKRNKQQI